MKEIWKDIKDYENQYQVSNLGRVRSLDREITYKDGRVYLQKGKLLKYWKCNSGYLMIKLKNKHYMIHRLVAETFIPNPTNKREVNHKNGIKTDNRLKNLEFVSPKENMAHALGIKLFNPHVRKTCKRVICLDTGQIFDSIAKAEHATGIKSTNICYCCKKKRGYRTAGGYKWEYKR